MRIVYLIGNGFDLAQGLKTTYNQFYKNRILSTSFPSGILKTMQTSIKEDVASWADLEKRLGEFTTEMSGLEDVDTVYDYLKKELREYLNGEESRITVSHENCLRNRATHSLRSKTIIVATLIPRFYLGKPPLAHQLNTLIQW